MPTATNDMLQSEAKLYLPPGAFIWRANVKGAWCVHFAPHKSHSESWAAHHHDSGKAMMAAGRFVWREFLDDHALDESHCPIKGIF